MVTITIISYIPWPVPITRITTDDEKCFLGCGAV
jgi:hypothetical protein